MDCREHDHRRCLELSRRISAYLDGELDASERRSVEEHLAACLACACCAATLKRTVELCRRAAPQPLPEPFARRLDGLLARLLAAPRVPKRRPRRG